MTVNVNFNANFKNETEIIKDRARNKLRTYYYVLNRESRTTTLPSENG